jgi:hypothetical protein
MKIYITLILSLTLLLNVPSVGQVLSDDRLYENGYKEVQNRNWPSASAFLYAYIQRNPVAFIKDKVYEKQVIDAYKSSHNNIMSEKTWLQNEITRKNNYIRSLEERLKIPASTSQGLSTAPEIPKLKKPVQREPSKWQMLSVTGKPLSGQWQATLTSTSGSVFTGTLIIVTNENVVTGSFTLSDNSDSKITGMYDSENLVMIRNTGKTTIQSYVLKKLDEDHFSGIYKNEGRVSDDGKIDLVRK